MARILEEETGKGRLPGRAALLHRRPRAGAPRRRARAAISVHRHRDVQEFRRAARHRRGCCRRTVSWSRPTRRISRRCRIAASATSRPMWSRPPRCWPRCAASTLDEIARQTTENFFRLFAQSAARRRPPPHDADVHHPRLRLVRRRAAPGARLGRLRSDNPKNRRRRCSLLVERHGAGGVTRVLVDTSPDLREQLSTPTSTGSTPCSTPTSMPTTPTASTTCAALFISAAGASTSMLDDADLAHADDALRLLLRDAARQRLSADPRRCTGMAPGQPLTIDGKGGPITALPFLQDHGDIKSLGFRFGGVGLFLRPARPAGRERGGARRASTSGSSTRCATRRIRAISASPTRWPGSSGSSRSARS